MNVVEGGPSVGDRGDSLTADSFPQGHFPVLARDFYAGTNVVVFFLTEENGISMVLPPGVSRVQFGVDQIERVRHGLDAMPVAVDASGESNPVLPADCERAEAVSS